MERESRRMEEDDEGVVVMGRKEDRLGWGDKGAISVCTR